MQKENTACNDRQLIKEAKSGNCDAFEKLFIKYKPKIYCLISKIIGNNDEVEDVVQDTFLKAYQKLHNFYWKPSFKAWLYSIARNQSKNYLRDKERREHLFVPLEIEIMPEDELEELIAKEKRDMVRKAIPQLPEKQQQVLMLRIYEELPYKEIAQKMEKTEEWVKVNIHRATKNLKKRINVSQN